VINSDYDDLASQDRRFGNMDLDHLESRGPQIDDSGGDLRF